MISHGSVSRIKKRSVGVGLPDDPPPQRGGNALTQSVSWGVEDAAPYGRKYKTLEDVLMSEIKKSEAVEREQNGGIDEMVRAAFGEGAVGLDGEIRENGDPSMAKHQNQDETEDEDFLERMYRAAEEHRNVVEKRIRREAKDSLMLGGLCGLGVVSLIVAAVTGVWVPVAVGLGVCLSAAAGALVYRGLAVMRG